MGKKSTKPRAVPPRAEKPEPAGPETPPAIPPETAGQASGAKATPVTALVATSEPDSTPGAAKPIASTKKEPVGEAARPPIAGPAQGPSDTIPAGAVHVPVPGGGGGKGIAFLMNIKKGFVLFFKELKDKESLRFLGIAIFVIAVSIGAAMLLGQVTYGALQSNASNAGHLYGIVTSSVAFFYFARYLRHKKDIFYLRRFLVFYFVIYFGIVMLILAFLQNEVYFLSTLGNSLILFSAYTLIIFILSPEILGVLGAGGGIRKLFMSGQHVRLIFVYLFIAVAQVTGFSLLDYSIQIHSSGAAYVGVPGAGIGTWFDFFYFSMVTFVTIGYGDIHPALPIAELSSTIQALLSHIISILFLAVLLLYLSSGTSTAEEKA